MEEHVALARFTTIGTGGPARFFARPESLEELVETLRWAAENDVRVETIGLGSNLLAADDGVDALVLKLAGELAAVRVEGRTLVAGGGAANAVASTGRARRASAASSSPSAIPGTAGGGVRMNAGAYGREWRDVHGRGRRRRRDRRTHAGPSTSSISRTATLASCPGRSSRRFASSSSRARRTR